jgi:peroxiredoxin
VHFIGSDLCECISGDQGGFKGASNRSPLRFSSLEDQRGRILRGQESYRGWSTRGFVSTIGHDTGCLSVHAVELGLFSSHVVSIAPSCTSSLAHQRARVHRFQVSMVKCKSRYLPNNPRYVGNTQDCILYLKGYRKNQDVIKAAGIDEVLIYCVNDGAVMKGWADRHEIEGSMITMMGDPSGAFTKACGMELTDEGPIGKGLIGRCKRWAMYCDNNIIKYVAVSEAPDDPAGDNDPSTTLYDAMLEAIKDL